jgi:hypothetical protein
LSRDQSNQTDATRIDPRLAQAVKESEELLARLKVTDLGALLSTLLPGACANELGPNGRVLLALVGRELRRRGRRG